MPSRSRKALLLAAFFLAQAGSTLAQSVAVQFLHYCNGAPVEPNRYLYRNESGTTFQINQLQYFVSDIIVYCSGEKRTFHQGFYIDIDVEGTDRIILPFGKLPPKATIDSVSFTFGLAEELNQSFAYTRKPENLMFWPEPLGGGYHYMKLNIKYLTRQDAAEALFNCHLGRGQRHENNATTFIDNSFTVTLPCSIPVTKKAGATISIQMDVEKWFARPNEIDFNNYSGIMQNQQAMRWICENGSNVFSIKK